MYAQNEVVKSIPRVSKNSKTKQAFLRIEVQILVCIAVFMVMGLVATFWPLPEWIIRVAFIGPLFVWMTGFLLLAALTPMPYPKNLPILIVRLRQLTKGTWAALMLVFSALLGASISADLIAHGTHDAQAFIEDVFIPGYLSFVVGLAFWGGMFIYMMLTATDLVYAREAQRMRARRRALHHLVKRLGRDNKSEWPYSIQLLESVWTHLTGGPVQLLLIGYLVMPLIGSMIFLGGSL